MKKSISELIQEALLQRGHRSIRIEDSNIFLSLVTRPGKDGKAQPGWRVVWFGLLVTTAFALLTFIIYAATFFIKDILLFDEKPIVTETGAIIPQRSCNREQVLFHFNASELWSRTGVQLQKGDRIRISHSGGFHSDVADIYLSVRRNHRLKYPYYTHSQEPSTEGVENCIYNRCNRKDTPWWLHFLPWRREQCKEHIPAFGSILWQVADENSVYGSEPDDIHQIGQSDAEHFIRIRKDGELFLTVNDILLTERVVDSINSGKEKLWRKDRSALRNDPLWAREHDLQFVSIDGNAGKELSYEPDMIRKELAQNLAMRSVWFEDNIGSVLICVEIERKTAYTHWFVRWYRYTERCMNWACDGPNIFVNVFCSVAVFFWSFLALGFYLVMFGVTLASICWPLSLLLLILFLPRLRRWQRSRPIRRARNGVVGWWRNRKVSRAKVQEFFRKWYGGPWPGDRP